MWGLLRLRSLGSSLGLAASDIEKALLRMEASGTVLRGNFTGAGSRAGAPAPHNLSSCARLDSRGRLSPHNLSPARRTKSSGASGGCWRGFTG